MKYFTTIFILFICLYAFGQKKKRFNIQNKELSVVLTKVERKFKVKFSYSNSVIQNVKYTLKGTYSFNEILSKLNNETPLVYENVEEGYYIVYKENVLKKDPNRTSKKILEKPKETIPSEEINPVIDLIDLDDVLIKNYLTKGVSRKLNGAIKIDKEGLQSLSNFANPDVLQSIQFLPGVISANETATDIQIRGGSADQNLILWDGIKMYQTGHFFGMFSAFNPYVVDKINVYRSATQSKYGDRVSGIVDIQSKNDIPNKIGGGIGSNLLHADAYLELPTNDQKFAFFGSARRSFNDLVSTFSYQEYANRVLQSTDFSANSPQIQEEDLEQAGQNITYFDTNLKLIWQPNEKNKISSSFLHVNNNADFQLQNTENLWTRNDLLDLENNGISIDWFRQWNSKWTSESRFYFSDYSSNYQYTTREGSGELDESLRRFNKVKDVGVNTEIAYQLNSNHRISVGAQWFDMNVEYLLSSLDDEEEDFTDVADNNLTSYTVFLNYEKSKEKLNYNFGVRSFYLSQLRRFYIEPRLNVIYKLNRNWQFNSSLEIKNQPISQFIEFEAPLPLENNIWTIADNDENFVIQSNQVTAGFIFRKKGWQLDVEGYYKKLNNLTSYLRGFNNNNLTNNVFSRGEGTTIGVDILLKKELKNYETWLSYTLSKTEQTFEDIQPESFPGFADKTNVLQWVQVFRWKQFKASLSWNYSTGNPYTQAIGFEADDEVDNEFNIIYANQNASRLKEYQRVDVNLGYSFLFDKNKKIRGDFGLSLLNIFNRKNELNRTFTLDNTSEDDELTVDEIFLQETTVFGLSFTPNLSFRISF